jgi:hypothetical protein|tara:strand:+ start:177 stop:1616 length:1440 start_codon:yes stop_codon:yes gene_type:complete
MSNLSELLPTGSGQNSVDFVASGTLSSGQTVALKADGTVSAVTEDTVGTSVIFGEASTVISATFDPTNDKVVIAYNDVGNSNYGTAIVGTVSGTSISFGTAVVFESANISTSPASAIYDSNANRIVIAYRDVANSRFGTAIVGTVSGTTISFGTAVVFESADTYSPSATFDSTNNKVVIAYVDIGNSNNGTAIVGTVSGTAISFGTAVVFESVGISDPSATYDSNSNKIVIAYNSGYGTAIVGTVSGTAISFGTAVVFESASSYYISSTYDSTNNKVIIAYADVGNSYYGTAIVGTVSGTSISFGTLVVFNSASTQIGLSATYDSNANKTVIAYRNVGNSGYGTAIVGTVSGTAISFNTPTIFESESSTYISSTYDSTNNKVVIAYSNYDGGYEGKGVVFTVGSPTNTDFIGITAEAISDTATGPVNVYGGINTVQTGLTIASDYYVQADGSLTTASASPAVKVGQAISATTINMKDLT